MRRNRILVTTSTLPCHEDDGEPRFVLDLSRALSQRFDVTILAPAHPSVPMEQHMAGLSVIRYRYAPLRRWEVLAYPGAINERLEHHPALWLLVQPLLGGLYCAVARLLRTGTFDAVHCHWAIPQGAIQAKFRSPTDPPYVLTLHGGDVYTARNYIRHNMVAKALKGAAVITAVSEAAKRHILDTPEWPVEADRIEVISMGCDLERFSPAHRDPGLRDRLGLTGPLMLFVGRLAEKKGLPILLRTMASDALRTTGACLAIAGGGPLGDSLETMTRDLGLDDRVRFLGNVPHYKLPRLYASADLFVAPYVVARNGDCEGLPTVLSEAGASGLASVVSDVGGVREIIRNAENGLLVPWGDENALAGALHRVLVDDALRTRLAATARDRARDFGWQSIGTRYGEVIDRTIARHRAN